MGKNSPCENMKTEHTAGTETLLYRMEDEVERAAGADHTRSACHWKESTLGLGVSDSASLAISCSICTKELITVPMSGGSMRFKLVKMSKFL